MRTPPRINGEPRPGPLAIRFMSCEMPVHTLAIRFMSCEMPVHTLAKNMGTSGAMIERRYSQFTPRLAASDLE